MKYAIEKCKCKCIIGVDEYMKYVIGEKCMIVEDVMQMRIVIWGCLNGG